MAEIDKSLPNISPTPSDPEFKEQEIALETRDELIPQISNENIEINPMEDGGAEISFNPTQELQSSDHLSNLAEIIDEQELTEIGAELVDDYNEYRSSRQDWEMAYTNGLDLLGFKYERRTEPFKGASGVTHPVLAESVTQFQSQAYKELLPADGPVRTQIVGSITPERQDQANRVKDFMNYQIMDVMKEYESEFDQMLFYLPLSGSTFKKVYYDSILGRAVSKFIPAEDLIVPYSATSLEDAEAVIHVIKISENDLRKQQVNGFYKDVELGEPPLKENEIKSKQRELEGIRVERQDDIYTLLECHVNLDLEGFEDKDPQTGEPTGIKLPYVVTIEEGSREVLSIRRNYKAEDPLRNRTNYFVHFKFLPGLGFYGFGLIHMIGGLSRTATSALRQLLDAGTLANLPSGFKMRGIRVRDDAQPLQPGEFRDVDAPGGNLKDAFMPLPFKGPDQVLLQLMGIVVQAGQRFASIADNQVGEGNQQAAVGTTLALLERGSRVMSAIHKRIYASLKNEFKLLADVFKTYLPPTYPYDVVGGQKQIKVADFDDRVDIIPVADPNIFSQTQRISLAQTQLQLAQSNPQIHNLYQAYKDMYQAIGVDNIDLILPPPARPMPMDPSLEHISAMGSQPFQAFPGQDHRAHIEAHLNFMQLNMVRNNPMIVASIQKNILEHISIMSQEQVQLEFSQELQQLPILQQQAAQNPAIAQQLQMITQKIESRKAVLVAEMTSDFMKEENKITSQFDSDPLLKLKSREVDLRAMENEQKRKEAEDRINLDKMKALMNQQNNENKLEQNEDLAKLRAGVSLAKQGVQQMKIKGI
jgi:cell division FtsZ-interacting protein ZapD